jgi:hypothetical protein
MKLGKKAFLFLLCYLHNFVLGNLSSYYSNLKSCHLIALSDGITPSNLEHLNEIVEGITVYNAKKWFYETSFRSVYFPMAKPLEYCLNFLLISEDYDLVSKLLKNIVNYTLFGKSNFVIIKSDQNIVIPNNFLSRLPNQTKIVSIRENGTLYE